MAPLGNGGGSFLLIPVQAEIQPQSPAFRLRALRFGELQAHRSSRSEHTRVAATSRKVLAGRHRLQPRFGQRGTLPRGHRLD